MSGAEILAALLVGLPAGLTVYAYAGYPLLLRFAGRGRWVSGSAGEGGPSIGEAGGDQGPNAAGRGPAAGSEPETWPEIGILVPAHDEADTLGEMLRRLLEADYPEARRQILVVSDNSTDGTDELVSGIDGVELLSLGRRHGKTRAQQAALERLRGEIVVNVDASIGVPPDSLKPLIRAFRDPTVGVASGRDVSVAGDGSREGSGEAGYVGYEMWVRRLETRRGSVVGASGCFYAARREVFAASLPEGTSRDFASVLVAREMGYRSVSVEEAVCLVPRTSSFGAEFRRKTRTMTRGLHTLWHLRRLLDPIRFGGFSFMLFSHKLCRWATLPAAPLALVGAVLLAGSGPAALTLAAASLSAPALVLLAVRTEGRWPWPRPLLRALFPAAVAVAGVRAWAALLGGRARATWEPTRRPSPSDGR